MKKTLVWLGLLVLLSAACAWGGYVTRSFAGFLASVACVLVAVALAIKSLRSVLTVMVFVLLSLALAEVGLGFLPSEKAQVYFDPASDYAKHYWRQTDIGSSLQPGRHGSRKLTTSGEVIYDTMYTIGDDGFRVTPGGNPKAAQRVNLLGCSVAFGEGLNDNQTLPYYLQQRLPDTTVKNFGVHGYGMHQALAILESGRDTTGKLNFLLTAPWHAERSACLPAFALGSPRYRLLPDGGVQRDGVCGGISYYPLAKVISLSRIIPLVKSAMQSKQAQDAQIDLYLALIQRIAQVSKERQQRVLVGFMSADDKWFSGSYTNAKIVDKLNAMGVSLVPIALNDKDDPTNRKYKVHALDEHPSALANQEIAALLSGLMSTALTTP